MEKEDDTYEILVKQNDINNMKRKFSEAITNILEDAKRRKVYIYFVIF